MCIRDSNISFHLSLFRPSETFQFRRYRVRKFFLICIIVWGWWFKGAFQKSSGTYSTPGTVRVSTCKKTRKAHKSNAQYFDFSCCFQHCSTYTFVRSPITESVMWDVFTFSYVILIKLGAPVVIVSANVYLAITLKKIWSKREELRKKLQASAIVPGVGKKNHLISLI